MNKKVLTLSAVMASMLFGAAAHAADTRIGVTIYKYDDNFMSVVRKAIEQDAKAAPDVQLLMNDSQNDQFPRWKPYFFYGISRLEPCVARLSRISCARCASFSGYFCCSATSTLITPLAIKENSSLLASVNSSRVVI